MHDYVDTIFALSTPTGRSGVAIIRVSGPLSWKSCALLRSDKIIDFTHSEKNKEKSIACNALPIGLSTGSSNESVQMVSHEAVLSRVFGFEKSPDGLARFLIDEALILPFQGPRSYTGEDCVEYHIHGSKAIIQILLQTLGQMEGHRLAEPGEFTRRAFENGKMDLTRAEAVADLIDAETQLQHQQALRQMQGGLFRLYSGWAENLKRALAHLEADIEFPDEDMPDGTSPQVLAACKDIADSIDDHLDDNRRGERLRDGLHVAIIGAPNAGKSSLINALSGRDVAIVSDMAGTTRDVLEVHLDLGGYPFILSDTAGLRPDQIGNQGQDKIESEGIRRALEAAQRADLKILMFDAQSMAADQDTLSLLDEKSIVVMNKIDEGPASFSLDGAIEISVQADQNIAMLLDALANRADDVLYQKDRAAPVLTRSRHRQSLEECSAALRRGLSANLPELMAEDIRLAVRELGKITGRVDVEDLLDVIFHDFCIGK